MKCDGYFGPECKKKVVLGVDIKEVTNAIKSFDREVKKAHKEGVSIIYDFDLQEINVVTLHKYGNEVDRNLAVDKALSYFHKAIFWSKSKEEQKELIKNWQSRSGKKQY